MTYIVHSSRLGGGGRAFNEPSMRAFKVQLITRLSSFRAAHRSGKCHAVDPTI